MLITKKEKAPAGLLTYLSPATPSHTDIDAVVYCADS